MRIILEVDDTTVALSITELRMTDTDTDFWVHSFDVRGASDKIIVIPKEGKAQIREADDDARAD